MSTPRVGLTVNWLPDGRLFAVGGGDNPQDRMHTVEMLHMSWDSDEPTESEWIPLEPLLEPRLSHGAAFISGKLVVAGGDANGSVECFTPPCAEYPKGQWTRIRPLQEKIAFVGMVPFGEGLLAVRKFEFSFLRKVSFGVYVQSGIIKGFRKICPTG